MGTDVGSLYRTSIQVTDGTGALVTPGTSVLKVLTPGATSDTDISGSIVTDSTGNLHSDYAIAAEGLHRFSWTTTSPVTSKIDYENGVMFRSVVGLGEMRDFLGVLDSSRDEILRGVMSAATELAEGVVGTCVVRTFTNEHIPGDNRMAIRLPRAPVISVTSVVSEWLNGPVWNTADLMLYAYSGVVEPANYLGFWFGPWKATYVAGRAVIPQRVILAVKEIVFDLWATQRMVGADQIEPGLTETSQYETQYLAQQGYTMPAHARALLDSEAMPGFG